jgi:hypothetical protein
VAPLRVDICGPPGLNHGLPLTVNLRATERSEHQEETYFAATLRASQPDSGRLWGGTVSATGGVPLRRRLLVQLPENKALGLYFLFAAPYRSWKLLFEPPLRGTVRIELETQGILRSAR